MPNKNIKEEAEKIEKVTGELKKKFAKIHSLKEVLEEDVERTAPTQFIKTKIQTWGYWTIPFMVAGVLALGGIGSCIAYKIHNTSSTRSSETSYSPKKVVQSSISGHAIYESRLPPNIPEPYTKKYNCNGKPQAYPTEWTKTSGNRWMRISTPTTFEVYDENTRKIERVKP